MDEPGTIGTIIAAVLAGGGLTALIQVLTKYWMERRGLDQKHEESFTAVLIERVKALESHVHKCNDDTQKLLEKLGDLKAENALLSAKVQDLEDEIQRLKGQR
jgi:predicted RNase H-like nuclease (RuvC/YqgF family)